jgi:ribose transport system substrate-binding protein
MELKRMGVLTAAVLASAVFVAGCSSSGHSTTSKSGTTSGGGGSTADVAAAKAFIADYVGKPSAFPTEDKLTKRPASGATVVFADAGTPVAALQWQLLQPAGKALGIHLVRVAAGSDASSISNAFDTIVSMKPAGVLIAAIDPVLYAKQLQELRNEGATVVASSIEDGAKYGFGSVSYGDSDVKLVGALLGAWTIARSNGQATNIALYTVPELAFSGPLVDAAQSEITTLCPTCETRIVNVPVAQLGTGAAQMIVSDVQAHPGTQAAIFSTDEMAIGLSGALNVAGLTLTTVGGAPSPENLQQIKAGTEDAALGVDLNEQAWSLVDQFAREHAGQALSGPEAKGELVIQFLTKADITFDPSQGWTGYPDIAIRFGQLWGTTGTS